MRVERLSGNPIIRPHMDGRMGDNINGPSLIRVPEWIERPLGRYYLYFAHHRGEYIRLAYADRLDGPWATYEPGTLALADSSCFDHIASPDVHVDRDRREIRMYFHGKVEARLQATKVAVSRDGIHFTAFPHRLGNPYFRGFAWRGSWYALAMPGVFYRSKDGLSGFVEGPRLFSQHMRHSALKLDGDRLHVFYTNALDCPERILVSTIALRPDWYAWTPSDPYTLLEPERDYEGADLPLEPSRRGRAPERVRQLRDPAIFREDGTDYLLYAVAGEHGLAIARLTDGSAAPG
jgi:hypothetical protein